MPVTSRAAGQRMVAFRWTASLRSLNITVPGCWPFQTTSPARALLAGTGYLLRRPVEDRLDGGPSCNIDPLVKRHPALLDQIDHRQQQLTTFGQKLGQLPFIGLSLVVDRVIASFHGGSSFQGLVIRFSLENQAEPPLNFQLGSVHPRGGR